MHLKGNSIKENHLQHSSLANERAALRHRDSDIVSSWSDLSL